MSFVCQNNNEKSESISNLSRLLKVISDENRLRILCFLKEEEKCVCEIYSNLGISQNLTSSHLKVLKDFGLIDVRSEWKRNYYSINKKNFKKYNKLIFEFFKKYQ
jgi:ArsR family transcriptional regulator